MKEICVYFGSSTGFTEMAAEKILNELPDGTFEVYNAVDDALAETQQYSLIIFGISTWDYGGIQEDWQTRWDELEQIDLSNKYFAVFGMGDQLGYAAWFQDAMRDLHDNLLSAGALPLGYWPSTGYSFNKSRALTEDGHFFVGLSLDDTNQAEMTPGRIKTWVNQVLSEYHEVSGC